MTTLYQELKDAGCRLAYHESDLYVKADDISRPIIRQAVADKRLPRYPTLFRSNDPADNALFYEIVFGYEPFWNKRLHGVAAQAKE